MATYALYGTKRAGSAAIELGLDVVFAEVQSGRTAIHDGTDPFTVGLAERRYPEEGSKSAGHEFRLQ